MTDDIVFLQRIATALESIAESLDPIKRAEKEKKLDEANRSTTSKEEWQKIFDPLKDELLAKLRSANALRIGHIETVWHLCRPFHFWVNRNARGMKQFVDNFDPFTFDFGTLSSGVKYQQAWAKKKKAIADANRRTRNYHGPDSPTQESTHPAEGNR